MGQENPDTSPGITSKRPSGFADSLAIFATIFTGAIPTDKGKFNVSRELVPVKHLTYFPRLSQQSLSARQVKKCLVERKSFYFG